MENEIILENSHYVNKNNVVIEFIDDHFVFSSGYDSVPISLEDTQKTIDFLKQHLDVANFKSK